MIPRLNFTYLIASIFIIGSVSAALFLALAPSLPQWGDLHEPHTDAKYLTLTNDHPITQTLLLERDQLDTAVLWFSVDRQRPAAGILSLTIKSAAGDSTSTLPVSDIAPDGTAIFHFTPLLSAAGQTAALRLSGSGLTRRLLLQYQMDGDKYPLGFLRSSAHPQRTGDITWQFRYRRPALSSSLFHWLYLLLLPFSGLAAAGLLVYHSRYPINTARTSISSPPVFNTNHNTSDDRPLQPHIFSANWLAPAALTAAVLAFYSLLLVRSGAWIGPADFSKELSYVTASAKAIRAGAWPVWSHYTCGGMGLLGNPEATTLSLSTFIALLTSQPELSLWLTLAIEAALSCLGTFLLSRALKLSILASLLAAIIVSLSAVLPYKIIEGIVMIGGPFALTPWVLLALYRSIHTRSTVWMLLGGLALSAIFWRGDVHIIIGVLLIMFLWSIAISYRQRRLYSLFVLITIFLIFFLGASIKLLPYLEQISLINTQVDPQSAQITQQHLWSDIFLTIHDRTFKVPVLHGLPEHFGYFGAYVGIVPIILLLISLLSRHPFRYLGWSSLLLSLILADGFLYEHLLRYLGPLSSLLRMPSRLLTISVLFIAILAGIGWDYLIFISRRLPGPQFVQRLVLSALIVLFFIFPAYDLSRSSFWLLHRYLSDRSSTILPPPAMPTLVAHLNESPQHQRHPSVLLQSGYLLPHLCGDQNNPPEFLTNITDFAPLADFPATLTPNQITLDHPPAHSSITIRSRFVSSWQSDAGILLPAPDQSIQLITPTQPLPSIRLQYQSATIRSQQSLLLTFLFLVLIVFTRLIYTGVKTALHFRHARKDHPA